jgi:hypothetical protein
MILVFPNIHISGLIRSVSKRMARPVQCRTVMCLDVIQVMYTLGHTGILFFNVQGVRICICAITEWPIIICLHECLCLHMCVRVCSCMCVRICMCEWVCVFMCVCVHLFWFVHMSVHVSVFIVYACVFMLLCCTVHYAERCILWGICQAVCTSTQLV